MDLEIEETFRLHVMVSEIDNMEVDKLREYLKETVRQLLIKNKMLKLKMKKELFND